MTAGVAPAAPAPSFEVLKWTVPGAEYEAVNSHPITCQKFAIGDIAEVYAGHALFNARALLGGQAAKAGLSCASCHINGRDNPNFQLSGVSDRPGTADVSHSFFNAEHGNARFDPIPIPDLALPGKVSRATEAKALESFIRDLIVKEFSGPEPSTNMLAALGSYVRSLRVCPNNDKALRQRVLQEQVFLIHAALDGALQMNDREDQQAVRALIAAARQQLGVISERYAGPMLKQERKLLLQASSDLQQLASDDTDAKRFASNIEKWRTRFQERTVPKLRDAEPQSLYNSEMLAKAFPAWAAQH